MRSIAANKVAVLAVLLLGASFCLLAQQQNVSCSDPPGGTITCDKGQLATCSVANGKVEGRCQTPPAELTQKIQLDKWVLEQVTDSPVKSSDVNKLEFQNILKSGRWQASDKVVTFHMSPSTFGNITQYSEGPDSPNVATTGANSPVTINPRVNPNAPVVTYDFNGAKHTQTGSKFVAEVGEQYSKFQEMATLEKERKWNELRNEAESQIAAAPKWLTPYLLAAEAYGNLGNKAKAIELCEHVKKESGGREEFDTPADKLIDLFKQKP